MLTTINKIRQIISPRLKIYALFLSIAIGIGAFLDLIGLGLFLPVVSAFGKPELIHSNKYLSLLYRLLTSDPSAQNAMSRFICALCVIVIVFYLWKAFYMLILIRAQRSFASRLVSNVVDRLFRNYMNMKYLHFISHKQDEYMNRILSVFELTYGFVMPLCILLSECMLLSFIFLILLFLIPLQTMIVMLFLSGIVFLVYLPLKRMIAKNGERQVHQRERILEVVRDVFSNMKEVRLCNAQNFFASIQLDAQRICNEAEMRLFTIGNLPRIFLEAFAVVASALAMIYFLMRGVSSSTIIVSVAIFVAVVFRLIPSFTRIQYNLTMLRHNLYLFDLIYQDLQHLPQERTAKGDQQAIPFERELKLDCIEFAYPGCANKVLDRFSLTIHPLESIGFVGQTGCGKSTLMDILMGFVNPDSGSVTVDGAEIRDHLPAWRSMIGYVPQMIYLSNASIRENIAFAVPPDQIDDARLDEVMELAQIKEFVDSAKDGVNTIVGDSGVRLSGGQRQRIAIARALYHQPKILIFDEATSALDSETENALMEAVTRLRGKLTILMIAHRISTLDHCDRIVKLSQ